MEITEIVDAVNAIQQDIFESTDGVEYFDISLFTNGFAETVSFCGIDLWCSEDDDRRYINGGITEERESIDSYLRRRLREELAKLATIKV